MKEYSGKSVCGGVAIGEIFVYEAPIEAERRSAEDTEAEIGRFHEALAAAREQLTELYGEAVKDVGRENAEIFEIHRMMLDDSDYVGEIENTVRNEKVNAEFAVQCAGEKFAGVFSSMEDEYMRERAADVRDISARLICVLSGADKAKLERPSIIVAKDLAPSETLRMDKSKILALITTQGSTNSHTAILARTMNIPAVVNADVELTASLNGKNAVLDGGEGRLYVEPTSEIEEKARSVNLKERRDREELLSFKGLDTVTSDGKKIMLYANIGNIEDLPLAVENDAGGIGLFRSEFIYMGKNDFPTEDEQFAIYKAAAEKMAGKKVIIRTLDIGADKQAEYFHLKAEENPAMGLRAIRICLTRPEIFKTQLRALYRASAYGNIAIMYPMIISVEEVLEVKSIVNEVRNELNELGVPVGEPEQGIMIETPAAAVISDLLAPHVDFFSIGTNDLSQYALAIDRSNTQLDSFFDPHHTAVLRLIEQTVKNAHDHGKWVGICGELGGDTELTEAFIKMGVDELSVSPSKVLPLRRKIRNIAL